MTDTTIYIDKPQTLVELNERQHSVIAASAGTGKTYTLEHLVIDKIIDGVDVDEILVVTFTRRATAEMQERIRQRLEKIIRQFEKGGDSDAVGDGTCWEIGDAEVRNIRRALNDFDDAAISTIHGFCQELLEDYAFSSGQPFDAELVDSDELYDRAFYDVLRDTLLVEGSSYRPWLKAGLVDHGLKLDDLKKHATNVVDRDARVVPSEPGDRPFAEIPREELDDKQMQAVLWHLISDVLRERVEEIKAQDGLLTYDDLLQEVDRRVEDGGQLADVLREKYRVVLVDEFQDTDPIQWNIVHNAFLDSSTGEHEVYVIGDEKQSIYGFRGADVKTFHDAIEHEAFGGREPVELNTNYRSTPELIDAYNELFVELFEANDDEGGAAIDYRPVDAAFTQDIEEKQSYFEARPALGDAPLEVMHFDTQGENVGKSDAQPAFVARTADEIAKLVEPDSGESVQPGEIYVLTRTNSEAEEVGDALADRGVPYAYYRKPGLFDTDEARDVLRLLRAIARPSDGTKRRKAMLTPFFGIRLHELDDYEAGDQTRSLTPKTRLETWNRLAIRREFSKLFDDVMERSGVIRRQLLTEESERRLTNYRHLFDWLLEQAADGHYGIVELADRLHRFREGTESGDEEEDSDLQRLETDNSAVQLMTIHKAKGLSSKVVFLCGGFSRRADENGRNQKSFKPDSSIDGRRETVAFHNEYRGEYEVPFEKYIQEEICRLIYVAITRAEVKTYVPYFDETCDYYCWCEKSRIRTLFQSLEELVDNTGVADSLGEIQGFVVSSFTVDDVDVEPTVPKLIDSVDDLQLSADSDDLQQLAEARFDGEKFQESSDGESNDHLKKTRIRSAHSYSSLADHGGDRGAAVELTHDTPLPKSIDSGNALHQILEHLPYSTAADASSPEQWLQSESEVRRIIDEHLEAQGFDSDKFRPYTALVTYRALNAALYAGENNLQSLARIGDGATAREVSFALPVPHRNARSPGECPPRDISGERGYFTGEIDLIFEVDGQIYLADWKSDTRIQGQTYEHDNLAGHVEENYREQIAVYTTAAMRMLGIEEQHDYEEKFGGFFYLFVRGMEPDSKRGQFFERLDWERVEELSDELCQASPSDAIDAWKKAAGSDQ